MLFDIRKCSVQTLTSIFQALEKHEEYVFWIRTEDMGKQIYSSSTFDQIWQQDGAILYELPLLWLDFLRPEGKPVYMKQLQERHESGYLNLDKNFALYQVLAGSGNATYIQDQCFKCQSPTGEKFIVGVAKTLPPNVWIDKQYQRKQDHDPINFIVYQEFLTLLEKEFGLVVIESDNNDSSKVNEMLQLLSKRELECLQFLCQGKSSKEIARDMSISHRTVETYIINIMNKTDTKKRLEVVARFTSFLPNIIK